MNENIIIYHVKWGASKVFGVQIKLDVSSAPTKIDFKKTSYFMTHLVIEGGRRKRRGRMLSFACLGL